MDGQYAWQNVNYLPTDENVILRPYEELAAYRFDFDKDFIPEGIKEETISEPNRNIMRTIVNSKDVKATYLKIVYGYGGVFYFKNSASISENMYNSELDNYRKLLK